MVCGFIELGTWALNNAGRRLDVPTFESSGVRSDSIVLSENSCLIFLLGRPGGENRRGVVCAPGQFRTIPGSHGLLSARPCGKSGLQGLVSEVHRVEVLVELRESFNLGVVLKSERLVSGVDSLPGGFLGVVFVVGIHQLHKVHSCRDRRGKGRV